MQMPVGDALVVRSEMSSPSHFSSLLVEGAQMSG